MEGAAAADRRHRAHQAGDRSTGGHGAHSRRRLCLQGARHRDRRRLGQRRRRAVSMGRLRRAASTNNDMQITPFFIDKYPVTNAQFKEFLDATHYAPQDKINFLRDWKNGTYPAGLGQPPRDLGFAGRCARLRQVGRQAPAARVGVAIGRAGDRRPRVIHGAIHGSRPTCPRLTRAAPCADPTPSMRIRWAPAPTA